MAPKTPRYSNVTTATRESITFDTADPRYKLARKVDTGSGSYGSTSPFRDPRQLSASADTNNRFRGTDPGFGRGSWNWTGDGVEEASRRSTNKAVTVEARTVEGSTRQTLGNRARVTVSNAVDRFGKGVSAAKGAAGKGTAGAAGSTVSNAASSNAQSAAKSSAVSAVSKVVSSSASGGPSVGWYGGGVGVGVSAGGLDLGVGFASVSYNFSNPNESAIGGVFNTLTITGTQEGCTITLDYKFMGKSYFKETRQADECTTPEPKPKSYPPGNDENWDNDNNNDNNEPVPPPGSESRTTTTTTTTAYNFGYPVIIYVTGRVKEDGGRDADPRYAQTRRYIYDGYIATLTQVYIEEVETLITTPFWTDPPANGEPYTNPISGIMIERYKETYIKAYPNSEYSEGYLLTQNWRINWGNYNVSSGNGDPFYLTVGTGWGNSVPGIMSSRGMLGAVLPFRHGNRRENSYLSFVPLNLPLLPNKSTISTPRTLTEPMEDRQQILLERVYQMLGGDTFWENGLAIPNEMFSPEGEGYTRTKSYNGVAHLLFDTLDHRTPGQVEYKLPNGMEYKSINATGYYQDLGANVAETLEETKKKESNNSQVMNYLTRNALLSNQIFKILLKTNRMVKAILSFLNVPVGEQIENVDIPFDLSLGGKLGGKGFGSKKEMDQEIDKLLQEELKNDPKGEKMAARLGSDGRTPITTVKIRESKEGGDFWWFIKQQLGGK